MEASFLDEEFLNYKHIARGLMKKLQLAEDKRVCYKYIKQCDEMKTDNVTIKANRNKFFRYLLKVMNRAVDEQKFNVFFDNESKQPTCNQDISQYSKDKKTYIAAKVIPGYGTLVYMAVLDKPEAGWEENGFAKTCDLGDSPNGLKINPL